MGSVKRPSRSLGAAIQRLLREGRRASPATTTSCPGGAAARISWSRRTAGAGAHFPGGGRNQKRVITRVRGIRLLRLRALVARAHNDHASYRELVHRHQTMAKSLGYEGHIEWAETMVCAKSSRQFRFATAELTQQRPV